MGMEMSLAPFRGARWRHSLTISGRGESMLGVAAGGAAVNRLWLIVALALVTGCVAEREILHDPLADRAGLAAKYPGDQGIEQDSAVIFAEDFERAQLASLVGRFTNLKHPTSISIVRDSPPMSLGRTSLRMTSIGGVSTGGTLYKNLSKGYELLYLRYYIKYPSGGTYHHTSAWLGGYNPPADWPDRNAGIKPLGHDRFSIAAEPVDANDHLDFYTYWMGMRGGPTDYWGNFLIHDPTLTLTRDRWTCVEIMVKVNEPVTESNGELALWIDGTLLSHLGPGRPEGSWTGGIFTPSHVGKTFEGFQWRNDPALQLNWFMLQHYATKDPPGYVGHVLFDHVVLATSRIGCLSRDTRSPSGPVNSKNE